MKLLLVFFVATFACAQQSTISDENVRKSWEIFQHKYGKSYRSPIEARRRLEIFKENLEKITTHNELYKNGQSTYFLGINQFADMTSQEFLDFVNRGLGGPEKITGDIFNKSENFLAPANVDWRNQQAVTNVKDQQQCGSCWAFSTTGSIEGQLKIKRGQLTSLSEQNLVDCSSAEGNMGCNGGLMTAGFEYVRKNGIEREDEYPYTALQGRCRADPSRIVTKISSYANIPSGDEDALTEAIASIGPISVAIDATMNLQLYLGGILNDRTCNSQSLNHGVLAVGYGSDNGEAYYIVKNSWGLSWGEQGFFRLAKNRNNQCGIASMASYPIL